MEQCLHPSKTEALDGLQKKAEGSHITFSQEVLLEIDYILTPKVGTTLESSITSELICKMQQEIDFALALEHDKFIAGLMGCSA